jgi:putative nucleotidyltransferase-like protein
MPWSPEWQVILTSLQMSLTDAVRPTITQALAQPSFDWEWFTARVCAHGVAPLVAAHLQKLGLVDHLPPPVRAVLQSAYYRNAARNTLLYGQFRPRLPRSKPASSRLRIGCCTFVCTCVSMPVPLPPTDGHPLPCCSQARRGGTCSPGAGLGCVVLPICVAGVDLRVVRVACATVGARRPPTTRF